MISLLKLIVRMLVFSLVVAPVTSVRADTETMRFLQRCHVYRNQSVSRDFGVWLASEKLKLVKHGVPIKLLLNRCDSLRFQIVLSGGKFTYVETDYPKMEDPDSKGNQYHWEPVGPSDAYWLFRFYGWEWAGWRLVHKVTGRVVETMNECADAPIRVGKRFIATICSGNYENVTPTLYVADTHSAEVRWSGGLVFDDCEERDTFRLEEMWFKDATHLSVRGYCSIADSQPNKHTSYAQKRITQTFSISEQGVTTKRRDSSARSAEWK